jgi:hypothetical protein
MANSNITLTSLDFADYKNSLKTFLQSQNQFKDYNFDASNLSTILDLLSYNTYLNAFYMNMVGSEMFLDTAQTRDSVVLRAKELNYTPRSFSGATALVNIVVANVPNNPVLLTISAGTSFTGKAGSNNYTFSTNQNLVIAANTDGNFYASNVQLIEGTSVTDTFVIQPVSNTAYQQYILSNPTIDTSTLTVVSIENNGANVIPYALSTTLLDLVETSPVYFLQGADNSRYQIIFGDNVVGRRPLDYSVVVANYLATNGQLPNGISLFTPNQAIGGSSNVTITTLSAASGGDISEDINSIRYNAPRYYATQQRAVTTADYQTLMTVTYPEIEAISVYGGETITPPQYGKVYLSLKLYNFDAVPASKITEYTAFLQTRAPLTITPVFIEPVYTYASVNTIVKYNVNQTSLQPADVAAYVTSAIQNYNTNNLNNFQTTLLYSKLVSAIDNALPSIVSNETTYTLMKKLIPNIGKVSNYQLNFNMPFDNTLPPQQSIHTSSLTHCISSTNFYYNGLIVNLEDDGLGNLRIVQVQSDGLHHTIIGNGVGTVDYTNGVVNITNLNISAIFGDALRIYAKPLNLDNSTAQNTIFEIPNDEINTNIVIVRQ